MENYKVKEWLIREYVENRRTANDIGATEKRDGKTIWTWLRKFGIPTRPRGGDSSSGSFQKGHLLGVGRKHTTESREKIRAAALADGRLPWGKDNEPYWKGRTGKDHPSFKGGLTPERQAVYSSPEWVDAVKIVWARDGAACRCCGKHHNTTKARGTFHVHHIVSFQVKKLQTDPENLVLLCKDCHKFVHSKKNTAKKFIKEKQNAS